MFSEHAKNIQPNPYGTYPNSEKKEEDAVVRSSVIINNVVPQSLTVSKDSIPIIDPSSLAWEKNTTTGIIRKKDSDSLLEIMDNMKDTDIFVALTEFIKKSDRNRLLVQNALNVVSL